MSSVHDQLILKNQKLKLSFSLSLKILAITGQGDADELERLLNLREKCILDVNDIDQQLATDNNNEQIDDEIIDEMDNLIKKNQDVHAKIVLHVMQLLESFKKQSQSVKTQVKSSAYGHVDDKGQRINMRG